MPPPPCPHPALVLSHPWAGEAALTKRQGLGGPGPEKTHQLLLPTQETTIPAGHSLGTLEWPTEPLALHPTPQEVDPLSSPSPPPQGAGPAETSLQTPGLKGSGARCFALDLSERVIPGRAVGHLSPKSFLIFT